MDSQVGELQKGIIAVSSGDVEWILYMSSWLNVAAVSLYDTQAPEALLDVLIMLFPYMHAPYPPPCRPQKLSSTC